MSSRRRVAFRRHVVSEDETEVTGRASIPSNDGQLTATGKSAQTMDFEVVDDTSTSTAPSGASKTLPSAVEMSPRKRRRHVTWSKTTGEDDVAAGAGEPPQLLPEVVDDHDRRVSKMQTDGVDSAAEEEGYLGGDDEVPANASPGKRKARPRGKGTGHGKKPHKHNEEYAKLRDSIMKTLFSLNWDPATGLTCNCAETVASNAARGARTAGDGARTWRCVDCVDWTVCCKSCIESRHTSAPFHAIQKWDTEKGCFTPVEPEDIDLAIYLGHGGKPCPERRKERSRMMTIGDISGIHSIRVFECQCRKEQSSDLVLQLFHSRLVPATMANPHTAYTFRLMEHWHLDVLQSKKPVYDYYMALTRRTRPDTAQDLSGYENFMRAGRWWRDLTSRLESGQGQSIDKYLPENRYPGSTAIVCAACPEPGFNMEDDWQTQMKVDEKRCRYIKFVNVDGDFKAHQKRKPMDLLDFPLNEGAAYFTPLRAFLEFERDIINKAPPEPHGPCEAIEKMHMGVDRRKTVWSGIIACVCSRHGMFFPRSIVNLRVGEKFPNIDLSLVGALGPAPNVDLPIAFQSDRGCHLSVKIQDRWEREFPELTAHHQVLKKVIWSIGKLHIRGHKTECQLKYHPSYMEGHGCTCGEGIERPWVETNHASAISRDANPGHREEIHNDTHNDWNKRKLITLSGFLMKKAKEAALFGSRAKAEFHAYAASLSDDVKARWWKAFPSEKAFLDDAGKLQNRCHADRSKLPSQSQLIDMIGKEETVAGGQFAKGRGPTAFIKRMIDLEKKQQTLKDDLGENEEDVISADDVASRRAYIKQELSRLRKLQMQHMPGLETVLIAEEHAAGDIQPDDEEETPEDEDLRLPSSFSSEEIKGFGWQKMADIEMRVRKCLAEHTLEKLRQSVRLFNLSINGKKQQMNTQMFRSRSQRRIKGFSDQRWATVARYMKHYRAMLALGYDAEKDKTFQAIHRKAVEDAKDVTAPAELGDSKRQDAWWWRDGQDIGKISKKEKDALMKLNDEEKRVRYFRYWANWKRFDEEWIILGAEFDRTIRSFERYEEIWNQLSRDEDVVISTARASSEHGGEVHYQSNLGIASGRKAYAKQRAELFRVLKERAVEHRAIAGSFDSTTAGRLWDGWKQHEKQVAEQANKRMRTA